MPVAEKLEHPAPDAFTDWIYIPPRVIGHRRHEPCNTEPLEPEEEIYCALKTGLHDYARKNGFGDVIVALSGGIDSALVAVIAADALGPGRVHAVTMPSPYTSAGTLEDARLLAANLGIELQTIPIGGLIQAYAGPLASCGQDHAPGVTGENLQARIRGNIVMALSNTFGRLVLATGNKSEMATGYCTLYGDMAGGFAVIKDVPKTMVYRLARWRNTRNCPPPIPARIISRPPSAELRPGQQDTDTLPPYDVLDRILEAYVEQDRDLDDIVSDGHESGLVEKVIRLVDHSEYKRRQAPPGIKITPRAFGRDRRMPITNHFTRRA
jgi:NAD+ synthase (glutamine-hydrolysing)